MTKEKLPDYLLPLKACAALTVFAFALQTEVVAQSTKNSSPVAHRSAFVPHSLVGDCEFGEAESFLDVNNVRARLFNTGSFFWKSSRNTYTVPKDSGINSIFTSAMWIGGLDSEGDLRFAGTGYGPFEYWPGPLTTDGNPPEDCSQYDHMFRISRTDIEGIENGAISDAVANWPYELGAPVIDGDGNLDNYDIEAGDRPDLIGDQMIWWVMNDAGNVKRWTQTEPLGLEVQVTAFAFDRPGPLETTTFYKFRIIKKTDEPITNMYFGWWSDPDLGEPGDDFVGSDSTLGLAITYNGDDFDEGSEGYGNAPPAIGFDLLQGPKVGVVTRKMDVFRLWHRDGTVQGNPTGNSDDPYQYLQGLWRDGSPVTKGGFGIGGSEITKYMYSGNAADREFWSEENRDGYGTRNHPADRTFLMSTGPFDMSQGDVQEIVLAIIWSRGGSRLASYRQLLADDVAIQGLFDNNFEERRPLDAPILNAESTDQSIQLWWENPPSSSNYLHKYSEESDRLIDTSEQYERNYEFEGYEVYQFDSPSDSVGELLATYDEVNELKGITDTHIDPETGLLLSEIVALGNDSGVQEFHTIDRLTNYNTYYFGVRAYAYNKASLPKVIFSPMARVEVTPSRVDARQGGTNPNHAAGDIIPSERITGTGDTFNIRGHITAPLAVRGDRYEVSFYRHKPATDTSSSPGYLTYDFVNTSSGDTLIAGVPIIEAGDRPPYGVNILNQSGISFEIDTPEPQFTNFLVTANAAGPITTGTGPGGSTGGAADFQGFPVPERPDSTQQVGPGIWFYATGDIGTGADYETIFIPRSIRNGFNFVVPYDYEVRFTETCYDAWRTAMDAGDPFATPENGCYGYDRFAIFGDDRPLPVPFELWNIGVGTPDDASDDFRMIPAIIDWEGDGYDLQFTDSSLSGGTNDPETDWMYWYLPCSNGCQENDYFPGRSGYRRWEDDILSGSSATTHGSEVMARAVFVNWNGGDLSLATDKADYLANVVNQDMPEAGTVLRMVTSKPFAAGDIFVIDTGPYAPDTNNHNVALQALDQIGIAPNPYRFGSAYEVSRDRDVVRFTNLPDRATIRIFTLSGTLVRMLEKDNSSVTLEWDLTNDYGLSIATGMYLIHIDVPGVGQKVVKFGALMGKTPDVF